MTEPDPQQRRSRLAWPTRTAPTTTPAGTHDHAQSNGPLALAFLCIVLLFLVNAALVWFIVARGETRDAREAAMRDEIRAEVCKLLGLAPTDDPLADLYRAELRCEEPGRVLPPTESGEPSAAPPAGPPPPSVQVDPAPAAAAPPPADPPSDTAAPSASAPPPAGQPPPADPPPRLLEPVTDPLCAVLGLCL